MLVNQLFFRTGRYQLVTLKYTYTISLIFLFEDKPLLCYFATLCDF